MGGCVDAIGEIRARLPIEQVVGEAVTLKRNGQGFVGLCPFHNEKTPSFTVSPLKQAFYCFGCQAKGDIFTFVMLRQKVSFGEALRQLAQRAQVQLESAAERQGEQQREDTLLAVTAAATLYFQQMLAGPSGGGARAYLQRRGLTPETVARFGLGFAPDAWDTLLKRLRDQGFPEQDILDAGLVARHPERQTLYDRFRNRIIFPIRDHKGRVLGFGGRVLDSGEPKYLNSPQGPLFDKSRILFALDVAQEAAREAQEIVLVEGYMDAVRAHQHGFTNVVATLGTAITPTQIQAAHRLADRLVLALDGDAAGQRAATRAGLLALSTLRQTRSTTARTVDLRVAALPDGQDPDDLIAKDPQGWRTAIAAAVPVLDRYFTLTVDTLDPAADDYKQRLIDTLLPVIRDIPGMGTQQTYLERLARLTNVPAPVLRAGLAGMAVSATTTGTLGTAGTSAGGYQKSRASRTNTGGGDHEFVQALQRANKAGLEPVITLEDALLVTIWAHLPLPADLVRDHLADLMLSTPDRQTLLASLLQMTTPQPSIADLIQQAGLDPTGPPDPEVEQIERLAITLAQRLPKEPHLPAVRLQRALHTYRVRLRETHARVGLRLQGQILREMGNDAAPDVLAYIEEQMATRHHALASLSDSQERVKPAR